MTLESFFFLQRFNVSVMEMSETDFRVVSSSGVLFWPAWWAGWLSEPGLEVLEGGRLQSMCGCGWEVGVRSTGYVGRKRLAVSQLDLLILQPWGKGVWVCVCVGVCGLCLSRRDLSILAHLCFTLWPSWAHCVCVCTLYECLCSSERQPGFHVHCVYCSPRFNGTLYIYVETTQTLTPLMLERRWGLV